jgi:hypothetical protein
MRIPIVQRKDPLLQTESQNAICKRFRTAFDAALGHMILPTTGRIESAPLYISERQWLATDYEKPSGTFPYEQLLDNLFWDGETQRHPLVFLIGDVGCGKSTLVDFYLRSYCPKGHENEYRRKLIVNVDLRNVASVADFDRVFYRDLRAAIREEYKTKTGGFDINSVDDYAMWDHRFEWDSKSYVDAIGNKSLLQYRAELVNQARAVTSDADWVDYALHYLSQCIHPKKTGVPAAPFSFIVLCLDNLDQSSFEVQSHAISVVRQWLTPTSRVQLWQVYVPLRTKTFDVIYRKIEPLPAHHKVQLGKPDSRKLLAVRSEAIEQSIVKTGGSVTISDDKESVVADNPLCQEFVNATFEFARESFIDILDLFAAGSVRRQLLLWQTALSSQSLAKACMKSRFMSMGRMRVVEAGHYSLCDALITGSYLCHHRETSFIANLFHSCPEVESARDSLCGFHLLYLLTLGHNEVDELYIKLEGLGYQEDQIRSALAHFEKKDMFRAYRHEDHEMLERNERVIQAHSRILIEPAYLDNMAVVTPVERTYRDRIRRTNSYDSEEFRERVLSTLAFLEQIKADEDDFCRKENLPNGVTFLRFKELLDALRIPSLFKKLAISYHVRLDNLRKRGFPSSMSEREWDRLLSHPLLSVALCAEEYLAV